jgi:RNA polymerase sigma-70 factor, ECF subfamily
METDDAREFEEIYETFKPRIRSYLDRLVGSAEAEDLAQEVFVKVHQSLKAFRGESRLSTWIYRIATNAAMDRLRSPAFRQRAQELLPASPLQEIETLDASRAAPSGGGTPAAEQELIRKEMNSCIHGFVEALPETYRAVLALSEIEGLKDREIAEVLGISLPAAKIRLNRARSKLREILETRCKFYLDERSELACDRKLPSE